MQIAYEYGASIMINFGMDPKIYITSFL